MSVAASAVINIVRDLIPDPTYDASGNPLPTTDGGLFRAQTLYRFLNDATKALTQKMDWVVQDWTAFSLTAHLPTYTLNEKWTTIDEVFVNGFRLSRLAEGGMVWPTAVESNQGLSYALHHITGQYNIRLFPAPTTVDLSTTLSTTITSSSTSITVASATSFLATGFIQVESELIQYYNISGSVLSGLVRGVGGTTAAAHTSGVAVLHCACWVKGARMPNEITIATDLVEVPSAFQYPLQLYVLSRCRASEQEFGESARLMQEFNSECQQRALDPRLKDNQGMQVQPYGSGTSNSGGLAWGRAVIS